MIIFFSRAPPAPAGKGGEYPTGGDDDALMGELTLDELKMAFRWGTLETSFDC